VDIAAAAEEGIFVANVPTGIAGNADSVAELGIYLMIGLFRGGLVDREALEEALQAVPSPAPDWMCFGRSPRTRATPSSATT
jgi:hypothetical protein